jgi:hypothetical protein
MRAVEDALLNNTCRSSFFTTSIPIDKLKQHDK